MRPEILKGPRFEKVLQGECFCLAVPLDFMVGYIQLIFRGNSGQHIQSLEENFDAVLQLFTLGFSAPDVGQAGFPEISSTLDEYRRFPVLEEFGGVFVIRIYF